MSSKFPIKGHPFGPEGNGGRFLLEAQYKEVRARIKTMTSVVKSSMNMVWALNAGKGTPAALRRASFIRKTSVYHMEHKIVLADCRVEIEKSEFTEFSETPT
jgi:hypothetical protein